jgi:uncharacterized protein (TIGR00290 family)
MNRMKAWMSWSSGKDSAWALHVARQQGDVEIVALLTTLNLNFGRVAMHGVREEMLDAQADALGLPLIKVPLPWPCSNQAYEEAMAAAMRQARDEGIECVVFGDLFLEEIRKYREEKLAPTGIKPRFPIWGFDTERLARAMVAEELRAHLTCIDPNKLPPHFSGRVFDSRLLDELPEGVDPCGENGEFHTFAFAGPMFRKSIPVRTGDTVERDGFVYTDLLRPEGPPPSGAFSPA